MVSATNNIPVYIAMLISLLMFTVLHYFNIDRLRCRVFAETENPKKKMNTIVESMYSCGREVIASVVYWWLSSVRGILLSLMK